MEPISRRSALGIATGILASGMIAGGMIAEEAAALEATPDETDAKLRDAAKHAGQARRSSIATWKTWPSPRRVLGITWKASATSRRWPSTIVIRTLPAITNNYSSEFGCQCGSRTSPAASSIKPAEMVDDIGNSCSLCSRIELAP